MADSITTLSNILDVAAFRQRLLSSNIANADTPGYKARDISFSEELSKVAGSASRAKAYEVFDTPTALPSRDGNTVNLDTEMAKMAETTLMYNSAVAMITMKFRMMKDIAKGGGA
jgi:flagellar basal-body rod protein FlgB